MAEATSDAFLSGQGIPVMTGAIESELARLWGPAAEKAGGPEPENPNVTRVVLANVVVGAGPKCASEMEAVLDTVAARYPCRAIVARRTDEPGRKVEAEIAALCHLSAPGEPQVCSERIVLRAGVDAVDLLPGAIRPLLEANLPFVLWWADDPREAEPLFRDLADECSRLILHLPDPGADPAALSLGLDPKLCRYAWDSAWFGISRWRELVAQFFDGPDCQAHLARITAVEIQATVPGSAQVPRVAAWLAAWLAGQLGWKAGSRSEAGPGQLDASFAGPNGPVSVAIRAESGERDQPSQITAISITLAGEDGESSYHLTRRTPGSPQIRVNLTSPSTCALPRVVASPELDAADRITAALESSRVDPPFIRAMPHALWLLGVDA